MALTPEQKREYARQWRARNRERIREYRKAYGQANRDRIAGKNRSYYARNGEQFRDQVRIAWLRRRHGLSPEGWTQMRIAQDGLCYLCGGQLGDRVVIDHDHSHCPAEQSCPVCRRGLAHDECNVAIGLLGDDPDRLRRIADALESAKQAVAQRIALAGEPLRLY